MLLLVERPETDVGQENQSRGEEQRHLQKPLLFPLHGQSRAALVAATAAAAATQRREAKSFPLHCPSEGPGAADKLRPPVSRPPAPCPGGAAPRGGSGTAQAGGRSSRPGAALRGSVAAPGAAHGATCARSSAQAHTQQEMKGKKGTVFFRRFRGKKNQQNPSQKRKASPGNSGGPRERSPLPAPRHCRNTTATQSPRGSPRPSPYSPGGRGIRSSSRRISWARVCRGEKEGRRRGERSQGGRRRGERSQRAAGAGARAPRTSRTRTRARGGGPRAPRRHVRRLGRGRARPGPPRGRPRIPAGL